MEMQQVRYFVALADTLNFTRAAERCNVTQPALTRAIRALEEELGAPLFNRERANTHLTELGRMMLPYFTQVMTDLDQAKSKAAAYGKIENVALSIATMCTIGPPVICAFIGFFRSHFPSIAFQMRELEAQSLRETLASGGIDVGLFGLPEDMDSRFHYLPLFQERFVVVLPPGHRLSKNNVVRCAELNGESYVTRSMCEMDAYIEKVFTERGIDVTEVFRSERDDWVLGMIRAGQGLAIFPEYSVQNIDLDVRPLIEPEFIRTIHLVTVRGRPHSPAIGALLRLAKSHTWPDRRG
jgi:DNA-binding transcriptional LysR family regulator